MPGLQRVVFAVPEADVVVSTISGSHKILSAVIQFTGAPTELILAGNRKRQTVAGGLFTIHTQAKFDEIDQADLVIVPAIQSDIDTALEANQALFDWLRKMYDRGAHLASLCSGAFLLGGAGILSHRRCTTHWHQTQQFRELFPNADCCKHTVLTEDRSVFTSGGAFTFLNLVVYLIERFYGKEVAQWAVGMFQVDYHRSSQNQFVLFDSQRYHQDDQILEAQNFIEKNFSKNLLNSEIAQHVKLGARTLARRFKASSGNTPNEYLQRVRIEKAKELLAHSDASISQIQYQVGYNDPKNFRKIFARYTSMTPSAYRRRYQTFS